jgi:hypothetical protein
MHQQSETEEFLAYIGLIALFGGILLAVTCLLCIYCYNEQKRQEGIEMRPTFHKNYQNVFY